MPAGDDDPATAVSFLREELGRLRGDHADLVKKVERLTQWMNWMLGAGFIVGALFSLFSKQIIAFVSHLGA